MTAVHGRAGSATNRTATNRVQYQLG